VVRVGRRRSGRHSHRYIVGTYHRRVHPETGQTPFDRWTAGDWLPRLPESLEELDLLLLTVSTPRKVQRDGIHCHGLRYFSITLAPYVGEPVTIRYDPRDLAEIRVYHHDEFLCRAVSPEIATVTVSMQDLQAAPQPAAPGTAANAHRPPQPGRATHPTTPADGGRRRWQEQHDHPPGPTWHPRLKLYRED